MFSPETELREYVDRGTEDRYLRLLWSLNINIKKGESEVVDIEKIKSDIADLELLSAEEYCKEQVLKIYADFEESRAKKIAELKTSLEIFEKYQIAEEVVEEENGEE